MTVAGPAILAAQYLRVSTEHQRYSLGNQNAAIHLYAQRNGFTVMRTYTDEGKSGLAVKRREGLQELLSHVVGGTANYRAILVYDVSRWGRFQDADEAAHYEFLCRKAGIRIHYCAEQFTNDNSLPNSMMKALKRVMAGEYSRELSIKVHEGAKRIAESGFRTGGEPGYGLRRMLVSSGRKPRYMLARGERKALQSDHVILVPGPDHEVNVVQEIFRMFTRENMWPKAIATELRRRGIAYRGATRATWYAEAVNRILKNPKYCGCSVFGTSTFRLHNRRRFNPRSFWTVTRGAWQEIVTPEIFEQAQALFQNQTIHKTDSELLSGLQRLLEERGSLSERLLYDSEHLPSAKPYVRRFGSLSEAFAKVGFVGKGLKQTRVKRNDRALRAQIVRDVIDTDPIRISLVQADGHFRPRFRVLGLLVSLYMCRCTPRRDGQLRWLLSTVQAERECIALIVRLNSNNEAVKDLFVVSNIGSRIRFELRAEDPWLRRGKQLRSIADFVDAVQSIKGPT